MTYTINTCEPRNNQYRIIQTRCFISEEYDFGCGMHTNLRTVRFAHDDVDCPICGLAASNTTLARYGIGKPDDDGGYTYGIHVYEGRFEDYAIAWGTDLSDWGVE